MRVLFAGASCLLDSSSGAAISTRTLLEGLILAGHQALALGATVFDANDAALAGPSPPPNHPPLKLFSVQSAGLKHLLLPTRSWSRIALTALEEAALERQFRQLLDQAAPDVLITYGGLLLERTLLSEARQRGIRTVFRLVNPNYRERQTFKDVDLIVTDSQRTAALYRQRLDLRLEPLGPLLNPSDYRAEQRLPRYLTFVNPTLDKGAAMVARLALMALDQLPDALFLVVESRGRWQPTLERLGLSADDLPNVTVWPMQDDMRKVYAQTKLLLMPSFWHESGGRVALEALLNGIPVLAENQGGIKEYLDGGGVLLEIPAEVRQHPSQLVSEAEAQPWFEVLQTLCSDPFAYGKAASQGRQAARRFDPQAGVQRFLDLLAALRDGERA